MQVKQLSMQRRLLVLVVTLVAFDGGWWSPRPISLTASAFSAVTPSSSSSSTSKAAAARLQLPSCPPVSPVTGLENRVYEWKHGQRIRYQQTNNGKKKKNAAPILLVHGLFVNSDHWRHTLRDLDEAGYNAYALDLFGCGYSDKPPAMSEVAQLCNGERGRFDDDEHPSVLKNIALGTPDGRRTRVVDVDLRHPLGSPYNFYTWAEQIVDFCQDVVLKEEPSQQQQKVTLVCNSIGTISSLQAVLDRPDLFQGVFAVSPNFRELHSAEVPYSQVTMVVLRAIQRLLRERGQPVFDALAKPDTVKEILKVPYVIDSAVDDALVEVLLDPLLTPGSSQVVFDLLSYSAGPLPEQQLQELSSAAAPSSTMTPVWIVYGDRDPWTPGPRVEALQKYAVVERVEPLAGVGHCPHDEAPQLLIDNSKGGGLLLEFLQRLEETSGKKE